MMKMLFLGDICPDNNYRRLFDENAYGAFSAESVTFFKTHDFVLANLECPATLSIRAITKTGPNIGAHPNDIKVLKNCGINNLSIANNHILDFGDEGVVETIDVCNKEGLNLVGGGLNKKDASEPLIAECEGMKVGILAFAEEEFNLVTSELPGALHFDPYESLEAIANLKKTVNRVVILYHGGIEYYKYPSPELQKKCRTMIRAGADLVLCQHSHCIGTIEQYQERNIMYGQGNTCFGWRKGTECWNEGLAVEYQPEDNSINLRLLEATENSVELVDSCKSDLRVEEIIKDSEHCYDSEFLKEEWLAFCRSMKSLNLPLLYGKSKLYNRINRLVGNRLIDCCYGDTAKMIALELIRCEAHLEVMKTILEDEIQFHTSCRKFR